VHGVGGIVGAIGTGILVNPALGGSGIMDYAAGKIGEYDLVTQVLSQSKGVLLTIAWSGIGTAVLLFIVSMVVGLRVSTDKEREGLDITDHGERAYNM
jgi:Amt family ammonium transporter